MSTPNKCEKCGKEMGRAVIVERAKNKRGKPLPPVSITPPPFCSKACRDGKPLAVVQSASQV